MKSAQELNSLALKLRREWGVDSYSPIDIFALVNGWREKNITIVRYPFSKRISGMCTRVNDDIIICVNSASSYGRQRFALAHELYHALYEKNMHRVVCEMRMGEDKEGSEREADQFASYLLMPYDALIQYSDGKTSWGLSDVIETEQFFQISHQAMVFRLAFDHLETEERLERYKTIAISREAAKLGYGKELYQPAPEEKRYFTTGEYIRKVEQMAERELISSGKREELLLDAYRADIVYNLDEEEKNLND
ncbi:ImmA/IrrE family metallo-endopeptidase [Clostridium sp. MCC353]|uniref:ImmA/IrrE family metallo-endopeptidase n=1 Tax=Clostridium sp. MCC353 TaxID=2592646 RepID=UPI001C02CCFD|nr:ImmA/IrrE family metallo-endopeptidase [Clostridium sp. MCC353]MBT9776082.1 ImmA/IrrE family metallo-endopeptidase [Clostridium sp. MCC353]